MQFSLEQKQIVKDFFAQHLEGQDIYGAYHMRDSAKKYLGIDWMEALQFARIAWPYILFKNKSITKEEFSKEMFTKITQLDSTANEWRKNAVRLKRRGIEPKFRKNVFEPYWAATLLQNFSRVNWKNNPSFDALLKDFKFFARFAPHWVSQKPMSVGKYAAHFVVLPHIECPLGISLVDAQGKSLLSVGGFLFHKKGKLVVELTNMQGVAFRPRGWPSDAKQKREHAAKYRKLSESLGMDWRVFFLNELKKTAARKGVSIIGRLPARYGIIVPSPYNEWMRQRKSYRNAFSAVGMKVRSDGRFELRSDAGKKLRSKRVR